MRELWQLSENPKFFKYGLAAILLVVPLYPKFPLFNIPGTYVAIRAEDFLLAILGSFWLLYLLRSGWREFFKVRFNQAILLFLGIGLLSVVSAVLLTKTVSVHLALFHWARRVEYLIPFFVALSAVRLGARPRFFAETLFIVAFLAFLYGLGQIYANFPVISTQNYEYAKGLALRWIPGSRLHSTFAGHYDLAAFLVLVFPFLFTYLFVLRRWVERIAVLLLFVSPSFWLMLQTGSRISFFSYLVAVAVALWVTKKRLFIAPLLILSILGMFWLSDLGDRYLYTINVYKQRIMNELRLNWTPVTPVFAAQEDQQPAPVVRSTDIRLNFEWPRATRAFLKNPLLGTGYSSITLATDNDYLRLLGEVGVAGLVAFFLVLTRLVEGFGSFFRRAQEISMERAFVGGFLGALVGLLVNATFIDVFEASKVAIIFWSLAGIAFGLVQRSVKING